MTTRSSVALFLAALVAGALAAAAPAGAAAKPAAGATPVTVKAGATTSGIDVTLTTAGSISGRLVDARTKQPVVGMAVEALGTRHSNGESGVFSDGSGRWTITGLPASTRGYVVCAYNEVDPFEPSPYAAQCFPNAFYSAYSAVPSGAHRITLASKQNRNIGDIALERGGRIQGQVRAPSGRRLKGVDIIARSLSGDHLTFHSNGGPSRTDGRYFIDGLPPSAKGWKVCFDGNSAATIHPGGSSKGYLSSCYRNKTWHGGALPQHVTPVKMAAGATRTGISGHLAIAGVIAGHVTASPSGKTVAHAFVRVYSAAGHLVADTDTDKRGHYAATGLHARSNYRVCAATNDLANGPTNHLAACRKNIRVRHGRITAGVNVVMPSGAIISGTVTSASTGKPVRGAMISLFDAAGHQLVRNPVPATGRLGHYSFVALRASAKGYYVCASLPTHDPYTALSFRAPSCYRHKAWDGAATNVPRSAPRVRLAARQHRHGVDIGLPTGGAITGRFTNASGTGLYGDVRLYNRGGQLVADGYADGRYAFSGLAPSPGGYRVCFAGYAYPGPSGGNGPYLGRCYVNANWPY